MKKLSLLTLVFSAAFTVLFLGPVAMGGSFAANPLMKSGDAFDLFTPLVLIPLYWLLFEPGEKRPNAKETAAFLVLGALWVEGQEIHLAGNSIGHWLEGTKGTEAYNITYFYDEVLGHYFWHLGIIGLSALVVYRQWRNQVYEKNVSMWLPALSGVVHGFVLFLIFIEGQTVAIGLPFVAVLSIFFLVRGRRRLAEHPLLLFFFTAGLVAFLLLAGWGVYWGGWPEFSSLGWI